MNDHLNRLHSLLDRFHAGNEKASHPEAQPSDSNIDDLVDNILDYLRTNSNI